MRRIAIIGSAGAGKTTLARDLGAILGVAVVNLDRHFWRAGWVETPRPEWRRVVEGFAGGDAWIIDGNYGGTMDIRLAAADTVIFLDLPRLVCIWRVVGRYLRYRGRSRPDLPPDCPEAIDWEFIRYIWRYPATRRPTILQKLADLPDDKRVVILQNATAIKRFLAATARDHGGARGLGRPTSSRLGDEAGG